MGFAAMRAGNGEIAEPAAEPGGGGGGFQHGAGIHRLIERVDEVPELMPIDHLSSEMWVENRDTTSGLVSHRHQESAWHLDAEDVEANPFGGAAVCECARNRQARHPVEHEVKVHGIWMHRNIFVAANSHVFEDDLVQMRHETFGATCRRGIPPACEVGHSATNSMRDGFQTSMRGTGVKFWTAVGPEGDGGVDQVSISIKLGERRAISGGPVRHGDLSFERKGAIRWVNRLFRRPISKIGR